MHVQWLRCTHFRNYDTLEILFHPRMNLFLGNNAQGKTNILEALYCLSTTRSFRMVSEDELIQFDQTAMRLEAQLMDDHGSERVALEFKKGFGKTLYFEEKKQKRLSLILGKIPMVIFSPDDLYLVKGGPGLRRKYLDAVLWQRDLSYLADLQQYERVLKQRNALLKKKETFLEKEWQVWNRTLSQAGSRVIQRRQEVVQHLERIAEHALSELTGNQEQLTLRYLASISWNGSIDQTQQLFLEKLTQAQKEERMRQITLVGPHRDDVELILNGKSIKHFGSQGQQRTVALALKLAQLTLLGEQRSHPLVLFDDVMAELDEQRQAFFLAHLQKQGQTFLTGTSKQDFKKFLGDARVFKVDAGRVALENEGSNKN